MNRKKLSTQDQKEIEELEKERTDIQQALNKMDSSFKIFSDKIIKKERDIEAF